MENENKKNVLGIVALVVAVVGIVSPCIGIGYFPALIALILSIVAMCKSDKNKGLAIAGLVCSIIGMLLYFIPFIMIVSNSSDDRSNSNASMTNTEIVSSQDETALETENETPVYDKEILFRDIPWGTSCKEVDETYCSEFSLLNMAGEGYKTYSSDDIIIGEYEGIDFEYDNINIISTARYGEVDVAGYMTKDIRLYFAYLPVDGVLTNEEKDSAFYGAQYEFEAQNLEAMSTDLIEKLTTLYGEPAKTTERTDFRDFKYTYTYWYGANDTVLVLKTQDVSNTTTEVYENQIFISYVWLKGDEMLQEASDILKQQAIEKEEAVYGNDSTGGL